MSNTFIYLIHIFIKKILHLGDDPTRLPYKTFLVSLLPNLKKKKTNKQTKIVVVNIILSNFMMVGCLKLCMYRIKKCIFLNDHF